MFEAANIPEATRDLLTKRAAILAEVHAIARRRRGATAAQRMLLREDLRLLRIRLDEIATEIAEAVLPASMRPKA